MRCGGTFQARGALQKYCDKCKLLAYREAMRVYSANYYRKHPQKVKLANKVARGKRHEHYLELGRKQGRRERERLRTLVLGRYSDRGYRCVCCGESEQDFLTIDHMRGNAKNTQKTLGTPRAGYPLYRWLVRNGFPEGFQVLCMNCNVSKGKHGKCAHKAKVHVNNSGPRDHSALIQDVANKA